MIREVSPEELPSWQIYETFRKRKKMKALRPGLLHPIMEKLEIDKNKGYLFVFCLISLLEKNSRSLDFHGVQSVVIKQKDPFIQGFISKYRNIYYTLMSHFIKHEVIVKIKGSTYFVNPFMIDNMDKHHWNQYREHVRVMRVNHSNNIAVESMKAMTLPQLPAAPQPADACSTSE